MPTKTILVYVWDEVGCETTKYKVKVPADGLTPRQTLILADDEVSQKCGDEQGMYAKKISSKTVAGHKIHILSGMFGRNKETRIYWCPTSDSHAAAQAQTDAGSDDEEALPVT